LLESVMEAYVEAGLSGATILDSEGMAASSPTSPAFRRFSGFHRGNKPHNKTILSVVQDEAAIHGVSFR
jgi:PII-like signaling protein